jgi:nitrate/nitrite-specific signal transduction histidine kinase
VAPVLLWIWIAAVVLALIVLVGAAVPVLRQLGGLRRAATRLQRRQADAMKLQAAAGELEQTLAGLQERAETLQERLAARSRENRGN